MAASLNLTCAETENTDKIHFVPCEIQYDGTAKVSQYFETTVRYNDAEKMTASLRGRPLCGEVMQVPSGYTGLIVKEKRRPFSEDEDRTLHIKQKFSQFSMWNLDRELSPDDKLHQALNWIDIASVVHRPVDEDSSQKSVVEK